jgi:hypothetical protein
MQAGRTTPPPLTVILLLGTALGLIAGLLIGGQIASTTQPREQAIPAPPVVQIAVTMPAWPTPVLTATPTPYPRLVMPPTPTQVPYYDPRWATPGRIYQVPPHTPPPPPTPTPLLYCTDTSLSPGAMCVAPATPAPLTSPQAGGPQ